MKEEKGDKYGYRLKNGKLACEYIKSEYKRLTNIWTDISETTFNTRGKNKVVGLHYAPKPVKAIERIIKVHTFEGDLILDCFLGSGTTAIACEKLNRRWIGVEVEEKYCKLAKNRIEQILGDKR